MKIVRTVTLTPEEIHIALRDYVKSHSASGRSDEKITTAKVVLSFNYADRTTHFENCGHHHTLSEQTEFDGADVVWEEDTL
jgi:hypothetical protein